MNSTAYFNEHGPAGVSCLIAVPRPTRPVVLASLAAAFANEEPSEVLNDLLARGYLDLCPSSRAHYRIAADTPALNGTDLGARLLALDAPPKIIKVNAAASGPLFSYYRGGISATVPYAAITPAQLHAALTSDCHRRATEALRAAPVGSPQRAELKKRLDYVTPAGTFARRTNAALNEPSGMLVLDFDHVPDVDAARAALQADDLLAPDLVLLFTSPSGDGLKALVRTDSTASHLDNFRACADYLAGRYAHLGLLPDEAGKDLARACFVPYDPTAWLSPAYTVAA